MSQRANCILQAQNIKKEYNGRTILEFDTLSIYEGDRIGIVGDNGAGKSTLLGILMGEILPEKGTVTHNYQTAYLKQFDNYDTTLSGGENRKKSITQNLLGYNQILVADEPTANLDMQGVAWVKERLSQAAAVVLVSHDRDLLNDLCTRIILIKDGTLSAYNGSYSDYERESTNSQATLEQERKEFDKKSRQLKQAIRKKEETVIRSNQNYKRKRLKNSSEAISGKMRLQDGISKKNKERKALETRLDKLDDRPFEEKSYTMNLNFSRTHPPRNKRIINCQGLSFSYGKNLVLDDVSFMIEQGEKVAIVGKNGAGKTTLMNQIYKGNPAISVVPMLKLGYLRQDFDQLEDEETVLENVMSTSVQQEEVVRNTLASLLFFGKDVFKQAKVLSGGEKIKLALAKLVLSDINMLLLDEPTNFLDIASLEALTATIQAYPGTVLFVSHDQHFCREVATRTLTLAGSALRDSAVTVKEPVNTDKILLDMRRIALMSKISEASEDQRKSLEQEYQEIVEELSLLK